MPAQWTAEIVGEMHLFGIRGKELAAEIGWNDKYLSQVLNGRVSPKTGEANVRAALERLKAKRREAH